MHKANVKIRLCLWTKEECRLSFIALQCLLEIQLCEQQREWMKLISQFVSCIKEWLWEGWNNGWKTKDEWKKLTNICVLRGNMPDRLEKHLKNVPSAAHVPILFPLDVVL